MRTAFIKGRLQEATFPRGPRSRVLLSSSSSLLLMLLLFSLSLQATTPFTTAPACSGPGGTLPRLLRLKRSPFCTSPLFLFLSLSSLSPIRHPPSLATPRDSKRRQRDPILDDHGTPWVFRENVFDSIFFANLPELERCWRN